MFNPLCLLIITSICCHYVAGRHIVQKPFPYPPYSDYSYTYSGPAPFQQPFQQHHAPFFSPPGTYFDQRQGILRPFPGGGVPVLVDYHKRCSDNFVGLKAHPDQQQYYYVCKPDCVIFGKCQNLQIFNTTSGQCAQHPPPEYIPTCSGVGRFPLFSNCHLYYKCEEDLQPKIYSCPTSMIFSPGLKKCVNGNKCTPTQISPQSSHIPEMSASKFPPCFENGVFRSPSDCSLYYKCDLKSNGVYMQTRLKCPQGQFYDLQKKECLSSKEVACDCIQVAELVYPKPNTLHFQPAVYPAQFELDSMVDGKYPVEQASDSTTEINRNCNMGQDEITDRVEETTTLRPIDLNNGLMEPEPNDMGTDILSDFINIKDQDDKVLSKEDEELTPMPNQLINSSEEMASAERPGHEVDSEEMPMEQSPNTVVGSLTTVTADRTEDVMESRTTTTEIAQEVTDVPQPSIKEEPEPFTILQQEFTEQNMEELATTAFPLETQTEAETATTRVSVRSIETEECEHLIENDESADGDTQNKDPSRPQNKKCFTKHTTNSLNTESELTKTTIIPETPNENISPDLTLDTSNTQTSQPELTTTAENLVITKIPNESSTSLPESKNLEENLLDSTLNLETAGATQSSEKTTGNVEQTTQQSEIDTEIPETENKLTTSEDRSQTLHTRSVDNNSLEEDMSYEDILGSEITEKPKADFLEPELDTKLKSEPELVQKIEKEPKDEENFAIETAVTDPGTSPKPLGSQELQEIEHFPKSETTTIAPPQATTIKFDSTTPNKELLFQGTTEPSTDIPTYDESAILGSEIKIDDFESATQQQENFEENPADTMKNSRLENISTNAKSVTLRQVDFSDEDFIPVSSKNSKTNELEEANLIVGKDLQEQFTTIVNDKEIPTTLAPTITTLTSTVQEEQNIETTTLKRELTSVDEAPQTTTQFIHEAENEQTTNSIKEQGNPSKVEERDELDVLNSEIVIPVQPKENKEDEEVSNNEISAAETTPNSSHQPHFSLSLTTTTSPTPNTQTPATTENSTTLPEPSEKQTENFILHVRKEEDLEQQPPSDSSPPRKSLYYILKTKPVINNNETNINHEIVTATHDSNSDSEEIPRLEVIAERPIDIRFSICPSTCQQQHKHNKSTTGRRAVLLKWFARNSKQTLGFETGNEMNMIEN